MVTADLHVHTTNSDGSMTLDEVPAAAKRAGVSVVAITDHDRVHPDLGSPAAYRDGVLLIHGIELRVETATERVDLLGYGLTPTLELEREIERLQTNRANRGARIIENVEAELGIDLGIEPRPGLGRPHIARAVAEATELTYTEVFDELIGDDGPCFVPREIPSFETGLDLLRDACDVVGLAHPFRYEDPEAALELCADLDAVERFYPYGFEVDTDLVDDAIETYDLLATGGSDAHDDVLGKAGLSPEQYERFRTHLSLESVAPE